MTDHPAADVSPAWTPDHRLIGPYQLRMLPLRPGRYTWTASWPGKTSRTGIAAIGLGQVAYPVVER